MDLDARAMTGSEPSPHLRHAAHRTAALAVLAMSLLATGPAAANGRYPLADQIVIDPREPAHLVARATFGLLDSDDGGHTWRWICESAFGSFGFEDPPFAVTASGSTVVAASKGLSISPDRGCSWTRPGIVGTRFGVDVTIRTARPHEALAILSTYTDGAYSVTLVETLDDGTTWNEVGPPFGADFLATTLEVAPTDPDRVYVAGKIIPHGQAALQRSDDGGHTWVRFPLDMAGSFSIYIGAVDPRNRDVVYLRTTADDLGRVLVSNDGGATWKEIWQAPGDVSGFALSADGTTLAVGGPALGVSVASTTEYAFRRTSVIAAYCLAWSGPRLLACAKEAIDRFTIGVSQDQGEHFEALLHLSDVRPRSCAPDASTAVCTTDWDGVATVLGVDAGRGDAALTSGSRSDAEGSCSCELARAPRGGLAARFALLLGLAACVGRRPWAWSLTDIASRRPKLFSWMRRRTRSGSGPSSS